jgi:hypothetical protein
MPFWQAALGYVRRGDTPDEDLVDPRPRTRVLIRADGGAASQR